MTRLAPDPKHPCSFFCQTLVRRPCIQPVFFFFAFPISSRSDPYNCRVYFCTTHIKSNEKLVYTSPQTPRGVYETRIILNPDNWMSIMLNCFIITYHYLILSPLILKDYRWLSFQDQILYTKSNAGETRFKTDRVISQTVQS